MTFARTLVCLLVAVSLLAGCRDEETAVDASTAPAPPPERPVQPAVDGNLPPVRATAGAETFDEDAPRPVREPDVIYVPTPEAVVDAMLEMAAVGKGDVLYDLGSGDGRIPIAAARNYDIRAIGIDIDPARIREANANAEAAGVADRVTFRQEDLFQTDIGEASVVTLYLLQSLNVKLRPKLLSELKPGTRIVSHAFDMAGEWEPEQTRVVDDRMIYMWTVPER